MASTTYNIVIVKSDRISEGADLVHTAKKMSLTHENLTRFANKNETELISEFKKVVDGVRDGTASTSSPGVDDDMDE